MITNIYLKPNSTPRLPAKQPFSAGDEQYLSGSECTAPWSLKAPSPKGGALSCREDIVHLPAAANVLKSANSPGRQLIFTFSQRVFT